MVGLRTPEAEVFGVKRQGNRPLRLAMGRRVLLVDLNVVLGGMMLAGWVGVGCAIDCRIGPGCWVNEALA